MRKGGVVPVSVIDAFFQMLPTPDIQQQAIMSEIPYIAIDTNEGLDIGLIATRPEQVYIWTDLTFYAMTPGDGMCSPPVHLDMHSLSGLLRFDLTIDNTSPMNLTANGATPYEDPANFSNLGGQSGWQTLDRDFGSTRYGSAFALYARSQQVTKINMKAVQRERFPRFVIDRIGFEIHGYVASEGDFEEVWRRTIEG